jgi:hypothetical protein
MATPAINEKWLPMEGADGWFALAPPQEPAVLGQMLADLRAQGLPVRGFVDRATLFGAWFETPTPLVVLELSARRVSISVAARDAAHASLRRQVSLPGGEQGLLGGWLELARATLVKQTRFDPLHDLRHESRLRRELPALAAVAQRTGQAQFEVESAQGPLQQALTRDQFAEATAPVLQPLAAALQSLSAVNGAGALLVPARVLGIPGMEQALAGARFSRVMLYDTALTTRALQQLPVGDAVSAGAVPYLTRLPVLAEPAPADAAVSVTLEAGGPELMATHVVYRGRALALSPAGIVLGRDSGELSFRLPDGVAGLSRRHCTLRREDGRSQIIDHSSHGSWLDGVRVRGRALLPAGSSLRLGDPGVELQLVALEDR